MAKVVISFFCGVFLVGIMGMQNNVYAQTSVEGGDSFESAVEIEVGSYQGGGLEDGEMVYFYIDGLKPGQELQVIGTFAPASPDYGAFAILSLYSEDEEELVEASDAIYGIEESITVSWLPNADEDSYKYYLKVGSDTWDIDSFGLDLSVTNRYDAETQSDVGDGFGSALNIGSGTYTGYLSGEEGSDEDDYYKINIEEGQTLGIEITPSEEAQPELYIYDSDREVIVQEYASNPGAIVKASVTAEKDDYVYVAVVCDMWCSSEIINYSLKISGAETSEAGVEESSGDGPGEDIAVGNGDLEGTNWGVILVVLGIVLVLIAVGVIIYLVSKRKSSKKSEESKTGGGDTVS